MAGDIIMQFGVIVFGILFVFLMFIFISAIASLFAKRKYDYYEPEVSVLIPCYNEQDNIEKCLNSLYTSGYPLDKLDVVIVDDGSTDNTYNLVKAMKKDHLNLKLVKGNHEGKVEALNLGLKHCKNEIILALDADTFVAKGSVEKIIAPMQDDNVGATNGSCVPCNLGSLVSIFQRIEYHYNNLIRHSLSTIFRNGIWFFGAFACYKKSVLKKIGYFKKDTLTEDMDTAMSIYSAGFKVINVHDALGHTVVPNTLFSLYKQRTRWWAGVLQSLKKNNSLFSYKSNPSIIFLFINQYWWSIYSVLSIPLITYQVFYWLPALSGPLSGITVTYILEVFMYLFRWFTLIGPFYVIYKIPEWGISLYNIFGVISGLISAGLIVWSIYKFKDKLDLKNIFAVFFYFPYTLVLNFIIIFSLIKLIFINKQYFID